MIDKEKAKRYDEALERAKRLYKANQRILENEENEVLKDIFPELAESEDERIRKELIKLFNETSWNDSSFHFYNLTKEEILTWLEKQEWSEEEKSRLMKKCVHKAYKRGLERGVEKTTNKMKHEHEWSEEDESILDAIIDHITPDNPFICNGYSGEDMIDWLKSLKPQNTWKPSEEQMNVIAQEVDAWSKTSIKHRVFKELYEQLKAL